MKIYRHTPPDQTPLCQKGAVVIIGNFDGVHKGHQAVLKKAVDQGKILGLPVVVLTFEPHPRAVLTPENAPLELTKFTEKCTLLEHYGADAVYAIDFTKAYAATPAEGFVEETLVKTLQAKHVVIGEGFAFGKGRAGNVEMLQHMGKKYGYGLSVVPPQKFEGGGMVYASTEVRKALTKGDLTLAEALLGHKLDIFRTIAPINSCPKTKKNVTL